MIDLNSLVAETMKYGFPGVVIIALAWVLWFVVKESKSDRQARETAHKEEVDRLRREKDELQEKRIAEGRESLNALNSSTNVLQDVLTAVSSMSNGKAA